MISLLEIIYTPSPFHKPYISWKNTARLMYPECLHLKDHCLHREMTTEEKVEETEITRDAGMIKPTTRSIGRIRDATNVARRDIQRLTSPRL